MGAVPLLLAEHGRGQANVLSPPGVPHARAQPQVLHKETGLLLHLAIQNTMHKLIEK